jgi:hypothetical protein
MRWLANGWENIPIIPLSFNVFIEIHERIQTWILGMIEFGTGSPDTFQNPVFDTSDSGVNGY